jgi:hypothetical protein
MIVEITLQNGERSVVEKPWHPGEMPLERVVNIVNNKSSMVLPP